MQLTANERATGTGRDVGLCVTAVNAICSDVNMYTDDAYVHAANCEVMAVHTL